MVLDVLFFRKIINEFLLRDFLFVAFYVSGVSFCCLYLFSLVLNMDLEVRKKSKNLKVI